MPLTKATTTTTRPKKSPLKATVLRVRIVNMVKKLASIFSRRKPQRGSGVAYNNSIIKFAEAPKSLEELVHPKYKGKIAMPDPTQHSTTAQWLASLYKILGKDKSDKFIRDLAAMKPILLESLSPTAERVSTGRHQLESRN